MNYSRTLDGLRGVAILLVLFFHYNFMLGCGWIGVQLFFVLSGFLISSILLREKSEPLGFYLKRFYWRRTLRIFPLYYAYLFLVLMIFLVSGLPQDFWDLFPFLATYTFNFYPLVHVYNFRDFFFMHFWSLSVEEQFYLVWPLVIYFCSRNQLKYVLIAIVIASPILRYFLGEWLLNRGDAPRYAGEVVYRFTLNQWDGFAFGAMIPAFALQKDRIHHGRLIAWLSVLILGLGLWNYLAALREGNKMDVSTLGYEIGNLVNFQHVWSYTLLDCLFMLVLASIVSPSGSYKEMVDRVLGNEVMVYLGKISYGLYVYHFVIWTAFNKYLRHRFPSDWIGFIPYCITCLVVTSISYFLFERRILSLKDKYLATPKPVLK